MLDGFEKWRMAGDGAEIFVQVGGSGPPLLLLHGYPQTHLMWHQVAPDLAKRYTVVCPDLRGYGVSSAPSGTPDHANYSKRAMAKDMVAVMAGLGFRRFAAAGHDRGGRVLHRMCLDHPEQVAAAAVLDIVPTRTVFAATSQALASGYYHWFFLSQPSPLPERLISLDPGFWVRAKLERWSGTGLTAFHPEAVAAYVHAFTDPAVVHGTCEDYRAAASVDLEHDAADQDVRIGCPLLVLWGEQGLMHRQFDVLDTWRVKASGPVTGQALACGHFLPEEQPERTQGALAEFLARHWPA
ncbi:alpha/beta fold hydrolase [Geminicoccus harenae]|uniref:alpha/beta fold hydrolase n=1 Tax=Geminicoccus harenae TaxID=2498453 RepID=UPI00168B31A7|nr:alpha/beta hydrolase [Geminicoccus harenae]